MSDDKVVDLEEFRNRPRITISADNSHLITNSSIVTIEGMVQFVCDGEIVGSLDIQADFSKLPVALHAMAANHLINARCRVGLLSQRVIDLASRPEPPPVPDNRPWWKKWLLP